MAAEGADIIDIGGESTRPGHDPVPLEEELRRMLPVIRAVRKRSGLPISIDTYKAETARQALEAGAHIVNDVWGFKRDPRDGGRRGAIRLPGHLTHNRDDGITRISYLMYWTICWRCVELARAAGVAGRSIWLDPGIGFAKDLDQNLELMGRLDEVVGLGYPVAAGNVAQNVHSAQRWT